MCFNKVITSKRLPAERRRLFIFEESMCDLFCWQTHAVSPCSSVYCQLPGPRLFLLARIRRFFCIILHSVYYRDLAHKALPLVVVLSS